MTSAMILNYVVDFDFHAETQSLAYVSATWEGNDGATEVLQKDIFLLNNKKKSLCFFWFPVRLNVPWLPCWNLSS